MPHIWPSPQHAEGDTVNVRIGVDQNGNLQAYIEKTAGRVSAQVYQAGAPGMVQAAIGGVQQTSRNQPGFFR